MKRLLMECLGTFFFLATVAVGANAVAIAAMYMIWLYIGAYISGANYNPMVTFAYAIRNNLTWNVAAFYMLAQVIGGFLAFAIPYNLGYEVVIPEPGAVNLFQALIVEILFSFALALLILTMTTNERFRGSNIYGFAIGFSIPALLAVGGPVAGGLFNPALAIGGSLFSAMSAMHEFPAIHLAMYVGGALIGAALAAYAYDYFITDNR